MSLLSSTNHRSNNIIIKLYLAILLYKQEHHSRAISTACKYTTAHKKGSTGAWPSKYFYLDVWFFFDTKAQRCQKSKIVYLVFTLLSLCELDGPRSVFSSLKGLNLGLPKKCSLQQCNRYACSNVKTTLQHFVAMLFLHLRFWRWHNQVCKSKYVRNVALKHSECFQKTENTIMFLLFLEFTVLLKVLVRVGKHESLETTSEVIQLVIHLWDFVTHLTEDFFYPQQILLSWSLIISWPPLRISI